MMMGLERLLGSTKHVHCMNLKTVNVNISIR